MSICGLFCQFSLVSWTIKQIFWKLNIRDDRIGQNWEWGMIPTTLPNIKIDVWFMLKLWCVITFPTSLCQVTVCHYLEFYNWLSLIFRLKIIDRDEYPFGESSLSTSKGKKIKNEPINEDDDKEALALMTTQEELPQVAGVVDDSRWDMIQIYSLDLLCNKPY